MRNFISIFGMIGIGVVLTACTTLEKKAAVPVRVIKPVSFTMVDGWRDDNQAQALSAFAASCARFAKADPSKPVAPEGIGGHVDDWQAVCARMPDVRTATAQQARAYFEDNFTPYAASDAGNADGLFTGYYEPTLRGSPVRTDVYQTPLRARPDDLVMVNLGEFRPELKGQRIAGRVKNGQLKPYEDRTAIETGRLPKDMDTPLYWVDSAVDAFFLQVQGSGVVTLPDGSAQRIGYDGQNGYPYTAIGKELIARGALTKDNVSMQSIRAWLADHPSEAAEVMRTNKSYVFFKTLDTSGPVGAEGVVLTPERSLAVDHTLWPYGMPVFLSAEHPEGDAAAPLRQLVVAQDTGGAITGVVRGDVFWGYGDEAAHRAGLMKSPGRFWVLLPKSVVPQSTP